MTFIKYSCKWIYLQRTIVPCGNLDALLNIIMVYYQEQEEVEYNSDLFNLFKIVINCDTHIDDSDYIMNWWKPKAIKRYTKLFDENRLKPEKLFYGDIVGKTWEETKEIYLSEVGR